MEVATCTRCKRMFNYIFGERLCPECQKINEDDYHRVRDFVYDHPGVTIQEVSEICDVPEKLIRQWLREEKLELIYLSHDLTCEVCGRPITCGRYCEKCRKRLVEDLRSAEKKKDIAVTVKQNDRDEKMRFLK